jgi:hypothetical protein
MRLRERPASAGLFSSIGVAGTHPPASPSDGCVVGGTSGRVSLDGLARRGEVRLGHATVFGTI